jgi:hypothetical protein
MIGGWNNSGVMFAALPMIHASGTGPEPFYTGIYPLYSTVGTSGNFIDMTVGYGYSGGYIRSDGSGYIHSDHPITFSPTSDLTIEVTLAYDADTAVTQNVGGSFTDANNYWYTSLNESGILRFGWNVDSSGGLVESSEGMLTNSGTNTIYFEKNATAVGIYVGSGECTYTHECPYDQGTGIFTDSDILNYNEMGSVALADQVCKYIAYDKALSEDEKVWNENNCTLSGLFGYTSGDFLAVETSARPGASTAVYVGYRRKTPSFEQQLLRGALRGTLR